MVPSVLVLLAYCSDRESGLRGHAGVRKNSAWLRACGILPHSGNHPSTESLVNSSTASALEETSVLQETSSQEERGYDEEARWQAVLARDTGFDGAFVYAVQSTGIYCRPSCPSRRPGREQVRFFSMPEAAEQAGFRPCRRCLPREAAAQDPPLELVQRACRCIDAHPADPPTLPAL